MSNPRGFNRRGRGRGRGGNRQLTSMNLPNGSTVSVDSRHAAALSNFLARASHVNPDVPNTSYASQSGTNIRGRRGRFAVNNIPSMNPAINDTQILIKNEKWFDVVKGVHKYEFYPGKCGIPQLDRFAGIYENYQLRYLEIHYRPSAGTTVPGNLLIGIDYNPNGPERKASDIALLEPNASGTIFTKSSIKAVINRVMKGKSWLYTAIAGTEDPGSKSCCLYVDAQTEASPIGQIWVEYKIAFTTATSGLASNNAVPIAITSAEIVDDIQISPPNDLTFDTNETSPITVSTSLETTEVSEDGTTESASFEYDNTEVNRGDEFTVGSMLLTSPTNTKRRVRQTPKISFQYSDGTPIPTGSIVPLNKHPMIFSRNYTDILATLFSIVKPLIKPFIGTITELLDPPGSYQYEVGEDIPELLDSEPEKLFDFTFLGDTAVINVPTLNQDTIASRLSTNFMVFGGRGYSGEVNDFISIYDTQTWSYENNWVKSSAITGTGSDSIYEIVFENPTEAATFRTGDLFFVHLSMLPLDCGFGESIKTPFSCPMSETLATALISGVCDESTLTDTPGLSSDEIKCVNIYQLNNTDNDGSKANCGLSMAFRFEGPMIKTYKYLFLSLPCGPWFLTINKKSLSTISKPEAGYCIGAGIMQVQFFPTTPTVLPSNFLQPESFYINKLS